MEVGSYLGGARTKEPGRWPGRIPGNRFLAHLATALFSKAGKITMASAGRSRRPLLLQRHYFLECYQEVGLQAHRNFTECADEGWVVAKL